MAAAGQSRENMIRAEEELMLRQVPAKRHKIVSTALNFHMVALGNSINAQVHQRPGGHPHCDLFAQEEIRMASKGLGCVNRVMVGKGYDGHTEKLQPFIDFRGFRVALAAD